MTIIDVLQQGIRFTNSDPAAQEMLADFKDHKVGMKLDKDETTIVIKDGTVALEIGMREDCHASMRLPDIDLCGAIDNSYDLMEIREKGEIIKGDKTDPNTAVHFMALDQPAGRAGFVAPAPRVAVHLRNAFAVKLLHVDDL